MARIAQVVAPACPPGFSGGLGRRRRFSPNPSSAFSAVSAVKERRVPRRCLFASNYPQRRTPKSACQKPSNSSQNRSKRRRFPSKSDQKGAHFVMPILTFCGWTPSGASARAVFAFPKGKKGAFSGAPGQFQKLSTISTVAVANEVRSALGLPPAGLPDPDVAAEGPAPAAAQRFAFMEFTLDLLSS